MPLVRPIIAPQCVGGETSVAMLIIASVSALSADPDLAQQEGYPAWSPQRLQFTSTAGGDVVFTDEDGIVHTLHVDALTGPIVINRPIRSIDESASGAVQVIAEWFDPNGETQWNKPA